MSTALTRNILSTHNDLLLLPWLTLAAGETGDAADLAASFADRSVQVSGTWGGATLVLQGSNDGTTYFTLSDPFANALSFTADALKQVLEITRYVRPKITGGDGTTALAVNILTKR